MCGPKYMPFQYIYLCFIVRSRVYSIYLYYYSATIVIAPPVKPTQSFCDIFYVANSKYVYCLVLLMSRYYTRRLAEKPHFFIHAIGDKPGMPLILYATIANYTLGNRPSIQLIFCKIRLLI